MTTYSRGDVVLVPFPFAELTGMKRRPALVVSSDEYNRHNRVVVIAQITSKIEGRARVGDQRIIEWEKRRVACAVAFALPPRDDQRYAHLSKAGRSFRRRTCRPSRGNLAPSCLGYFERLAVWKEESNG